MSMNIDKTTTYLFDDVVLILKYQLTIISTFVIISNSCVKGDRKPSVGPITRTRQRLCVTL